MNLVFTLQFHLELFCGPMKFLRIAANFFFFFNLMKQHLKLNSCSFLFQIISGSEIPLINILTLQGYKKSCVISVPTSYFPSLGILIRFNTEWIEIFTLPLLNT